MNNTIGAENRTVAALILLGAVAASALWVWGPERLGGWPLLVALLPWIGFWIRRRALWLPWSAVDLPLLIFLATAGVAVWAAYDRGLAMDKFWVLVGAVLLFYALAIQPPQHLWPIAGLLALLGVGVGGFFLLTHDWTIAPAGIRLSDALGRRWMALRGSQGGLYLLPNRAAGLMALSVPFALLAAWRLLRSWGRKGWVLVGPAGGLLIMALLLTGSRGALFGLLCGVIGWLALSAARSGEPQLRRAVWSAAGFMLLGILVPLVVMLLPGNSPNIVTERLRIGREALFLVEDYMFTGGGLGAFPALYSQYILVVPFYFFPYSHNLFLDVAVEQGVLGGLAFGLVWLISLASLWRRGTAEPANRAYGWLMPVLFGGLITLAVDGLLTDTLYGVRGTPLLFLYPGLGAAVISWDSRHAAPAAGAFLRRSTAWAMATIFALLVLLLSTFHNPFLARWYANLGAVAMAQTELADWPPGRWDDGSRAGEYARSTRFFEEALHRDLFQRTAHHRLGLIAMGRRNYPAAIVEFEVAAAQAPDHPGLRKALAYSLVWNDAFPAAEPLLRAVPEAVTELPVYAWWWGTQERPDLAELAAQAAENLAP